MSTYYINADSGNDSTGSGTSVSPWATISKAYTSSVANDTIICQTATATYSIGSLTFASNRTIQGASVYNDVDGGAVFDGGNGNVTWKINGSVTLTISGLCFQNVHSGTGDPYALFDIQGSSATLTVTSCAFKGISTGASVTISGLVFIHSATGVIVNFTACLFKDILRNGGSDGSIFCAYNSASGTINITNCTIVVMTTAAGGGLTGIASAGGTLTIIYKNCIVYNGSGGTIPIWNNASGTVTNTATYSDFYLITSSPSGTGVITTDPKLVDAVNGNYALRYNSPCRGTGSL